MNPPHLMRAWDVRVEKGKRLPTPQQYLDAPETTWTTVDVTWYDGQQRVDGDRLGDRRLVSLW